MSLRAKKPVAAPVSKLPAVLHGLGVTRIEHDFDASQLSAESSLGTPDRPVLRLHEPHDEVAIRFSDTKQLQQMGRHLIRWRAEVERQQSQLQSEQKHWTKQMQLEHEVIAERNGKLDHRERQIKSIEFQLMQLQNDLIDAQVALEHNVKSLTECQLSDNQDGQTIAELKTLRFELIERFEHLMQRWTNVRSEVQPATKP